MGALLETINFLKCIHKFSVFKLKKWKLVPHHIGFVFISMFGREGPEDPGKVRWGDLLLLEKGMCVLTTPSNTCQETERDTL